MIACDESLLYINQNSLKIFKISMNGHVNISFLVINTIFSFVSLDIVEKT